MDALDLIFVLLAAALGWFWYDGLRALEAARTAGRRACGRAGVQFLDDTVASVKLGLGRYEYGRTVLCRVYRFEFSDTGDNRLEGRVVMLGARVETVEMEPYRLIEQGPDYS